MEKRRFLPVLYVLSVAFLLENAILLFPYVKALLLRYEMSPVLEGQRLAERMGCFSCHGPLGTGGVPNPGSESGEVPSHDGGTIRMYVQNDEEIAEYIRDGMPLRKKQDSDSMKKYEDQLLKMPSYGRWLSSEEVDLLVAFVKASNGFPESRDEEVVNGENLTLRLGCTACHGPRGGGGIFNPGSFKGYVPGWLGSDFRELIENDEELVSWIERGTIERFEKSRLAQFFLRRQPIQMPAYKDVLSEKEIRAIVRYLKWLNETDLGYQP